MYKVKVVIKYTILENLVGKKTMFEKEIGWDSFTYKFYLHEVHYYYYYSVSWSPILAFILLDQLLQISFKVCFFSVWNNDLFHKQYNCKLQIKVTVLLLNSSTYLKLFNRNIYLYGLIPTHRLV